MDNVFAKIIIMKEDMTSVVIYLVKIGIIYIINYINIYFIIYMAKFIFIFYNLLLLYIN